MGSVKCTVEECQYNKDVMCDAPMIQVNHTGMGKAHQSKETQCDTFKPKE